jgi:glycosyltransferase involved in cell wall biosynthesis
MILSIVMITVPERKNELIKLKTEVKRQIDFCKKVHPDLGMVEIREVNTKKFIDGGASIGSKRQAGLNWSLGNYVCWLDDDDWIAPDYVETILRLAMSDADVLVFNSISRFDSFWCLVQMNLDFFEDEQVMPGIVHRRPYHVCAWKRELLLDAKFPDTNVDEDTGFISQVLPKCKSQAKTEAILHEYNRLTKSLAVETWESVQ